MLSRRVRLNTHLNETELIAAAFIIQGWDPWNNKKIRTKYLEYIPNHTE